MAKKSENETKLTRIWLEEILPALKSSKVREALRRDCVEYWTATMSAQG